MKATKIIYKFSNGNVLLSYYRNNNGTNGMLIDGRENGDVAQTWYCLNDKESGLCKSYYEHTGIKSVESYNNGTFHGIIFYKLEKL